jgi:hypothetical protein
MISIMYLRQFFDELNMKNNKNVTNNVRHKFSKKGKTVKNKYVSTLLIDRLNYGFSRRTSELALLHSLKLRDTRCSCISAI